MEIRYSQLKINHLNDTPSTKAARGRIFSGVFQQARQGASQGQEDFELSWYLFFQQYSQFLNPVGHDVTMITSFDIPCNSWPVLAPLVFAGICFILQLNLYFFLDPTNSLTNIFVENSSGSSLNLQSFNSVDNLFFKF
jgi:hypothetical protein